MSPRPGAPREPERDTGARGRGRALNPRPGASREPEPDPSPPTGGRGLGRSALPDLLILLGSFAIVSAIAGIAGAPNLGTALSFGQIGFGLAAVYVVLRR